MLELEVIAPVLLAALMHASWNAIVKQSGEPVLTFAVVIAMGALYLPALPFVPPPRPEALPYLATTTAIHHLYYFLLLAAYRWGDLSQVYPIARGTAPLLVAAGSFAIAGEPLAPRALAGVSLICVGIFSLLPRSVCSDPRSARGVSFALATGVVIAGYTLCDGLGVRRAGEPLSYVMWGNVLGAIPYPLVVFYRQRARLPAFLRAGGRRAALGGAVAVGAYSIAVWAMSQAGLALVASLRETSVVIAAVIGARWLGEPFGLRRVLASSCVLAGVAVLSSG